MALRLSCSKTNSRAEHVNRARSIRLQGFDYAQAGAYFVTICSTEKKCIFGQVREGAMLENDLGRIVRSCWVEIPRHFANVEADAFVVMPNHFHGIVKLVKEPRSPGSSRVEAFSKPVASSVPTIVRTFKAAVTREARRACGESRAAIWQKNYFERVIRNDKEYSDTYGYILENPMRWGLDRENPAFKG